MRYLVSWFPYSDKVLGFNSLTDDRWRSLPCSRWWFNFYFSVGSIFLARVWLLVKFYSVVYVSGGEKQRND